MLIDSGIVKIKRCPLAAQMKARPMPVLPLVGSITTVSFVIKPCLSAVVIIDKAIRSFTLPQGFLDSSFARTVALFEPSLLICTNGV